MAASGEATAVQQQHLSYYTHLVETAEAHIFDAGQTAWLERLEEEHPNLRAALHWGLAAEDEPAATLAVRLAG